MNFLVIKERKVRSGRSAGRLIALCLALLCMMSAMLAPAVDAAGTGVVTLTIKQAFHAGGSSAPPSEVFSYRLTPKTQAAPMPSGSTADGYAFTASGTGEVQVGPIRFDREGVYAYKLLCETADKDGYIIDRQVYTMEAYIMDDMTVIDVVYTKDGNKAEDILFEHSYDSRTPPGDAPMSVRKVWAGVDSPPNDYILVQLYRGGVPYGNAVTLSASNQWKHTWDGLDPAGPWTVDEFDVAEGCAKTIAGSARGGFVITNTRDTNAPGRTTISGSKTWEHGSNPAAQRPKSIVLRVYANGVFILQKEVGETEHWSWSLRMDKYDKDGREIKYTVDESPVAGYTKTVRGFDITNTYDQGGGPGGPGTPGNPGMPSNPRTDDMSNLNLWVTLFVLSAIALAMLIILSRRRKRREEEKMFNGLL